MMVPSAALVIPQYLLFRNFGMLDSFWPLILPSFFAQPYNVFLFRQFFVSIPDSIDEAAMLDGCSRWQAFWKVIVPLGKPIFITVGIMSASFWWNELFSPLVYINSEELKPLTLGVLTSFVETSAGASKTMWNLQMAFSMLMIIPPALLYICCINSAAGFVCHMMAMEKTSAQEASLIFFLKPILAPIFALIFLKEEIPLNMIVGIVCFLIGSLCAILPGILAQRRALKAQK